MKTGNTPVNISEVTRAIAYRKISDNSNYRDVDECLLAIDVMNHFGFDRYILDNILEPEEREKIRMMEDWGLITTFEEVVEIKRYNKPITWRLYYWQLKIDQIRECARKYDELVSKQSEEITVYDDIPMEVWKRDHTNSMPGLPGSAAPAFAAKPTTD